jgi:hypothetical protein
MKITNEIATAAQTVFHFAKVQHRAKDAEDSLTKFIGTRFETTFTETELTTLRAALIICQRTANRSGVAEAIDYLQNLDK